MQVSNRESTCVLLWACAVVVACVCVCDVHRSFSLHSSLHVYTVSPSPGITLCHNISIPSGNLEQFNASIILFQDSSFTIPVRVIIRLCGCSDEWYHV